MPELQHTPEGWELQFATNHLGHFALALGLHDALAAAGDARIVSVSSSGHLRSPVVFDDLHFERPPYDPWVAYGQSKTANVLFAVEATRRWAGDGIIANALHPGGIVTNLQRHMDADTMRHRDARPRSRRRPERSRRPSRAPRRSVLARHLAAAGGRRRPLLRGLQRGRGRRPAAPQTRTRTAWPRTRWTRTTPSGSGTSRSTCSPRADRSRGSPFAPDPCTRRRRRARRAAAARRVGAVDRHEGERHQDPHYALTLEYLEAAFYAEAQGRVHRDLDQARGHRRAGLPGPDAVHQVQDVFKAAIQPVEPARAERREAEPVA